MPLDTENFHTTRALLRRLHSYLGDGFAETPLARALVAEIENALGETR